MSADVQKLLLRIDANTELAKREIIRLNGPLEDLGTNAERGAKRFGNGMQQVERSSARVQNATRNLGFQFDDFTTQISTGTSVFQAFGQQAGQAAGALADFGGTAGKVGAFLSGPYGAIIIAATTLLGGLAVKHFMAKDGAEAQEGAEKTLADALTALDAATGASNFSQEENIRLKKEGAKASIEAAKKELEVAKATALSNQQRALAGRGRTGNFGLPFADSGVTGARNEVTRLERQIFEAERRLEASEAIGQVRDGRPIVGRRVEPTTARTGGISRATSASASVADSFTPANMQSGFELRQQQAGGIGAEAEIANGALRQTADILRELETYNFSIEPIPDRAVEAAAQFNENLSRGLGQAIVQGQSLGDALVNSIKAAAAELISSGLLRLLSGGAGGGGGIVASLFGGFFASGGRPPMGRVSVVGERGPELFVPSVPGEIIPNYKLGGGMGAGSGGSQEVMVTVAPSPLFITTVASASQASANEAIRQRTRSRLPMSAGA